ncbi:hypothetical protein ID866_8869 [Astraeus odoratus]|nr:hypothetical protein ID866_8869 [Astraeus odoratus]
MSTGQSNEPEDASILTDPNESAINVLQRTIDERFSSLNLGSRVTRDLSKHLGTGAYGVVYPGTLLPEQTSVAVKVIRSGGNSVLPLLERILREVHIWSTLHHENILPLLGITTVFDDTISIVSPLMSRGNAFQYVQDPSNDPRPLILGLARALGYLHNRSQPIIHGDIKGSNVLVSDDGHAQLADFGFSATVQTSLGAEQRVGGTLNWMAPEYVETDKYTMTTAGDIWAFGMTALELFTRMRPHHHLNGMPAIVHRILTGPPERPSAEVTLSRLTDGWWEICLACWGRNPTLRSTMSEITKRIVSLDATSNVTIPASEPTQHHTTSETVINVSAWMGRGTAREYVQNTEIDPRPLILGTARGLHYLHNHPLGPIIHGDMKGSNVLISDNGLPLLYDFGLSLFANSSFSMSVSTPRGGTLRWSSPEVLSGGDISPKADVWGFGMLALELFTRKEPFHSLKTYAAIAASIDAGHLPDRPRGDDTSFRLTDVWWDICLLCWKLGPWERPTMSQIIEITARISTTSDVSPAATDPEAEEEIGIVQESVDNLPEVSTTRNADLIPKYDVAIIWWLFCMTNSPTVAFFATFECEFKGPSTCFAGSRWAA